MNTRKRGPNLKDKARDKQKEKPKDKSPAPKLPKRIPTVSTSEPRSRDSTDEEEGGASTDDATTYERPQRTEVVSKGVKREYPGDPAPELPKVVINDENYRPSSVYQPLAEGEFRILKLAPGKKDDRIISCSFVTASLDRPMKYEAISYLWGAAGQRSMEIHLADPQGKLYAIFIRSHLYEALKFLRHPSKFRYFWVDALCINHGSSDKVEKNKQIAMKRFVFRNAENLCFWLGEDESSKTALKFIPRILDLTGIDSLVRDESTVDDWIAFVALLKNPVFGRLWLVQEVAVAQNVTLHCGQAAIHYGDLVDAVAMFRSFRNQISLMFRSTGRNAKELSARKVIMAERFIEVSANSLRITTNPDKEQKTHRLFSLEALVSHLCSLDSTDPLDRIYSVLAIAKDGPKLDEKTLMPISQEDDNALQIDYEADFVDVYEKFVIRAIQSSQSLDIMCRYWVGAVENLPSWVRPIQLLQPALDGNVSERTEADSLVGLPDHNDYHASRGTKAKFEVKDQASVANDKSKVLCVRGIPVDTIDKLGPRASEGIILYEWLALAGCVGQGLQFNVPEEFWRTLVADRGPNGTMAPSWYARAFRYCLQHLTPTGDINTNRLISLQENESSLGVSFLNRVQGVIWNRKFLVSKKNGWFGLGPMATTETDIICVLYGCSVPVILRPMETEGGKKYFLLVGECYVHGIMDGEIIEAADKYGEEVFDLR
jgi:hypothetical protein